MWVSSAAQKQNSSSFIQNHSTHTHRDGRWMYEIHFKLFAPIEFEWVCVCVSLSSSRSKNDVRHSHNHSTRASLDLWYTNTHTNTRSAQTQWDGFVVSETHTPSNPTQGNGSLGCASVCSCIHDECFKVLVSLDMSFETMNERTKTKNSFSIYKRQIALRPENTFLFTDRRSRGLPIRLGLGRNAADRSATHNGVVLMGRWVTEGPWFGTRKSRTNELCRSRFVKMADLSFGCLVCEKFLRSLLLATNVVRTYVVFAPLCSRCRFAVCRVRFALYANGADLSASSSKPFALSFSLSLSFSLCSVIHIGFCGALCMKRHHTTYIQIRSRHNINTTHDLREMVCVCALCESETRKCRSANDWDWLVLVTWDGMRVTDWLCVIPVVVLLVWSPWAQRALYAELIENEREFRGVFGFGGNVRRGVERALYWLNRSLEIIVTIFFRTEII